MIKRWFENTINHFGIWHSLQAVLAILSMILLITAFSQLLVPVRIERVSGLINNLPEFAATENISTVLEGSKDIKKDEIIYRPRMFKPATGLQDKPLANKTIERIKEQLKLQCVMEINGQLVAYINIQGAGLKKCCIGEKINDLFTLLDINEQNKSVEISILDHKVTLHL